MNHLKRVAAAAAFMLSTGLSPFASAALMEYNGTGGAVPPSGTLGLFTSSIIVEDAGTIGGVSISLNDFSHTWIGDIFATLAFADGLNPTVSLVLFGTDGELGPGSRADGSYTFADGGAANFDIAGSPIPSGTYAPIGTFSVFDGLTSAGTWTLNLDDQIGLDSGTLSSWTLSLSTVSTTTPAPVPAPGTLALLGLGLAGLGWSRRKNL